MILFFITRLAVEGHRHFDRAFPNPEFSFTRQGSGSPVPTMEEEGAGGGCWGPAGLLNRAGSERGALSALGAGNWGHP